jgi:hypothetical protein
MRGAAESYCADVQDEQALEDLGDDREVRVYMQGRKDNGGEDTADAEEGHRQDVETSFSCAGRR